MILEIKKITSVTVSIVSPSICQEVMGLDAIYYHYSILRRNIHFNRTKAISKYIGCFT